MFQNSFKNKKNIFKHDNKTRIIDLFSKISCSSQSRDDYGITARSTLSHTKTRILFLTYQGNAAKMILHVWSDSRDLESSHNWWTKCGHAGWIYNIIEIMNFYRIGKNCLSVCTLMFTMHTHLCYVGQRTTLGSWILCTLFLLTKSLLNIEFVNRLDHWTPDVCMSLPFWHWDYSV